MFDKFKKNKIVRGSITFFILFNLFNLFNFIFNFGSARLLGPADYRIIGIVMVLIYIFSVPGDSIQTIISRYTTKNFASKGKVKELMLKSLKKFFLISLVIFFIFAIVSPLIGNLLNVNYKILILAGVMIISVFLVSVNRGILQGEKKFKELGWNFFSEAGIKLVVGICLILVGMAVYGAVLGIILGAVFALIMSFFSSAEILKEKSNKNLEIDGIFGYSLPVLISIATITLFYSMDIILANLFFSASPEIVGKYTAISMLGKIIFFGTMPISRIMFPLVSENHEKKKDASKLLKKSFLAIFIISLGILIFYFLFSEIIISIIYGRDYIELASYLIYPSISMVLLSLSNIFIFYNLSTHKKNVNYILPLFLALQIFILFLFHANLLEFMIANIGVNSFLFVIMGFISRSKTKGF